MNFNVPRVLLIFGFIAVIAAILGIAVPVARVVACVAGVMFVILAFAALWDLAGDR